MLSLTKVIVNNFLSFGEAVEIPLDNKGITLLVGQVDGDTNKSNGAGKSSVLSCVTFALYGKCVKGRSADSVVNRFSQENCFVELHWSAGKDKYIVRRSRKTKGAKPNDLTLFKNGKDLTRTTATETQEVIEAEFGITYEAFLALMPGTNKLAEMSDAEIKKLIESVLGINKYTAAYDKCKQLLKEINSEISFAERELTDLKARKQQSCLTLDALKSSRLSKATEVAQKIKAAELELKKAIAENEKLLFNKPVPADECTKPSIQAKKAAKEAFDQAKDEQTSLAKKAAVLLTQFETTTETLVNQRDNILKLDTCPTCLACVTPSHKSRVVKELEESHKDRLDEFSVLKAKLARLESKAQMKVNAAEEALTKAEQDYLEGYKKYEAYKEYELKLADWKSKRAIASSSIEKLKNTISLLHNSVVSTDPKTIEVLEEELSKLEHSIEKSVNNLELLNKKKERYEFWQEAFSPKGIRAKILEQVIPFMNAKAKLHAQALANGELLVKISTVFQQKSKKIVEDFNIKLEMANGGDSWDAFSAGERARAATILSLTLGDLASVRSGKSLNFLVVDEVLDPIDAHGSSMAVSLLESLKEKYSTVFLVTHKEGLQSLFEQRITLHKEGKFTTVKC